MPSIQADPRRHRASVRRRRTRQRDLERQGPRRPSRPGSSPPPAPRHRTAGCRRAMTRVQSVGRTAIMDGVLHRLSSPTFVGRAEELAVLEGALQRAATGTPAFAFIAGESGVGKSRLIAEFEIRAREAGAQVFVGHCLELGGTVIPYAPVLDALRPVARELALCGEELRDSLTPQTRLALAELMPEFGSKLDFAAAGGEERTGNQSHLFEGLLA